MKSFVCMFEIGKEEKGGGEGRGGGFAFINSVQYVYKFDQQSRVLFKLLFCLSSLSHWHIKIILLYVHTKSTMSF